MNNETDALKAIAEEIATREDALKLNPYLATEAKRLEKAITNNLTGIENFTQRDSYHFNTLRNLVYICDLLYDITGTINPNVSVVMDLLTAVAQVIPTELRPNLKLPKAFITLRHDETAASWLHHSELMMQHNVPEKLIAIAAIPFKRFTEPKLHLFWGDYTWLKAYESKLDILDWENADCNSPGEALTSLLIGRDFNDDRFFIYCKKYITERVKKITGKRNRVLEYAQCEKLVLEDTQVGVQPFDGRANSVSARLIKWIREEIDFVETHEREVPYIKMHFDMYVNRIAFFFKLLHEQKLFGDTTFKELAQQIASTCLSAEGEEIQAATIISKAYPKDQKMLEEMEALLVKMLEYVRIFMRKR